MSHEYIESPALHLQGRGAVCFRGRLMFHSTAARINEFRKHVRRMADEGMTMAEASRKLGYANATVRRWSEILGIQFRKKYKRVKKHDKTGWEEAIMAGAAKGLTLERIGMQLDVNLVNIHRYCRDNGINWRELKRSHKHGKTN